ncbi:MAG: hypothetical protein JGK26_11030 [Microcoleus sp. PH2017_27_LUM_O_A]|nr:hypothetical protein [Microcoleus sp. PH2017_12_PCY_D_A]MCC3460435.1 hypothetical protein [Microcoleus sp. PH2017_11_PCY_U_A]MCC3559654.1 hypothetical protein [Microcoleus sp. PH2017_27_LUM_O_A]
MAGKTVWITQGNAIGMSDKGKGRSHLVLFVRAIDLRIPVTILVSSNL